MPEIIAEKIRACYQRDKARDIYDLGIFASRPLDQRLVCRLVVLKLWQARDSFDPDRLMRRFEDGNDFDWDDLGQLVRQTFTFALRTKRTYLDRGLANAVMAEHAAISRTQREPLLLVARYIPRPTGERLANAGVNFVDRVGNMHLALGDAHRVLLLGRHELRMEPSARRPGPALIQLYFVLLAEPAAVTWPVRTLATAAGVGKTAAATGLQRLVRLGVLARTHDHGYRVVDRTPLVDDFIRGYTQVLRAHLLIGRFRSPDLNPERCLRHLVSAAEQVHATWAVTGGPAAHALDRFYQGESLPLFFEPWTHAIQRTLRLVPDRQGPVILLRPFGELWAWRVVHDMPVAHPWLVYAELLHHGEPRALEAAEHLREGYLQP